MGFSRLMCLPLNRCLERAVAEFALTVVFIAEIYNSPLNLMKKMLRGIKSLKANNRACWRE